MIDLGSTAALLERNYELHAYCATCDRWAALDLAAMISRGQSARRLPLRVRCRWCGAGRALQVRPPMLAWTNSKNGWQCGETAAGSAGSGTASK